ncbi:acyltransferase domain-containing protein [Sphingomonas ginsenosidivorax]|uniref:Acyltransferase domain-containing protein n=1 Tax=Sphingomonas ginsenosidivorax TaxID=862135 RepID=A0A5C6UD42_9SPHN|nr:acyltransferase domain-containing protein [Sphingomonas ginsenosidivorax]TXC70737.1 acyltransferase domain-containing protein [Sphingomonas ginsenosidivorax]
MTLALLCSGQGRQSREMFALFADAPAAAPILAAASAALGQDVQAFLETAGDAALYANRTSQILCVARGLAAAACLAPTEPFLVAGYSVGEMTAWGVAGLWPAEQTLRLTAIRAEAMDAAGGRDDGLGFVRGLPRDRVAALVDRFDCAIAIVNPGLLFVIGGARDAVERCCAAALEGGAHSARPIAVHVASHTPRLSAAVPSFRAALEASEPRRPSPGRTLIGAADASIVTGARGIAGLAAQVCTTVDWAATLDALVERGVDRVLELGPGTALADMVRSAYPLLDVRAVDDFRGMAGVAAWVTR